MSSPNPLAAKVTVVAIDWPFGACAPNLHCPRTGKLVLAPNTEIHQPASPNVAFVYINEVGEFDYIRPDLEAKLEAAIDKLIEDGTDEDDLPSDIEVLTQHVDLGGVPLVFEITTSGMACGPTSSTVTVGFDLWSKEDGELA